MKGKRFAMWMGQTATVEDVFSPATRVLMPADDVIITAAYEDVPATLYKLVVNYGTGSGSYAAGVIVPISAAAPPEGSYFLVWDGQTDGIEDETLPETVMRMPNHDATITATYATIPPTLFPLTVTSGSGSGAYTAGTEVAVVANPAPDGQYFAGWTGQTSALKDVNNPSTIALMPAGDVTVVATYADVPPTLFDLTVTKGSGSGTYTAGTVVRIDADAPADGYYFVSWTGQTDGIDNIWLPSATLRMPESDVAIAASYAEIPPTLRQLVVANGSGSGAYTVGAKVAISANPAPDGKYFAMWSGQTSTIENVRLPITTLLMPDADVSIKATYKDVPPTLHSLTVTSGKGSGQYTAGTRVAIAADAAVDGKYFAMWTGQTATVENPLMPETSVTMPEYDVTIAATYEDVPPLLIPVEVVDGKGSGAYTAGTSVDICANPPPDGWYFVHWTGDTSTVEDVRLPSTTIRVPAHAVTVTAIYAEVPPTLFTLTVTNGSGSGAYTAGATVAVAANPPDTGKYFVSWTGDTGTLANTRDPWTTLLMPACDVKIAAAYADVPPTLRTLTVTSGTGSGAYTAGAMIPIAATPAAEGKYFVMWTGQSEYLANARDPNTEVFMPDADVAVTATYADVPPMLHQLEVVNGSGAGTYTAGTTIPIEADAPATGKYFVMWTGQTEFVRDVLLPSTVVIMPDADVRVAAVYADVPPTLQQLTVAGGSGSGAYTAGTEVKISAATPASGKYFAMWTGQTDTIENIRLPATTLRLPDHSVSVSATYEDVPPTLFTLTVTGGSGSGAYTAGTDVRVVANTPSEGQVLRLLVGPDRHRGRCQRRRHHAAHARR